MLVEATASHERFVRSLLDYPALVQHHDGIGIAHGGEAMRDYHGGAVHHELFERVSDRRLVQGVEVRGRLVQDQYRRVLEKGAGDCDPLALPAGESHAALAHPGIEAVGHES